jgi:hypothetical protein
VSIATVIASLIRVSGLTTTSVCDLLVVPPDELREKVSMNLEPQADFLREKHTRLQRQIDDEYQRPIPDDIHLHELKREKLRLKDEIAKIET